MQLLRFITAGSVDDGKSTLIGRLLYDSKVLLRDQLAALGRAGRGADGGGTLNLALLTDGLRAEREQGITIDVAYKYFTTPRRRFIIADTPGHVQYTRNMVTGASSADLAILLVDARQGILEQTRRHAYLAELLGIPNVVLAINKMDLVGFDEQVFARIRDEFQAIIAPFGFQDIATIPLSALRGDNVVEPSSDMPWYRGQPLLRHLEEVTIRDRTDPTRARLPVQIVIRPGDEDHHDYRGFAGRVSSGTFKVGDEVVISPSGLRSTVAAIDRYGAPVGELRAGMSGTLQLRDDVDVGRGDVIAIAKNPPSVSRDVVATICWMAEKPLVAGARYLVRQHTSAVKAQVAELCSVVNIHTFANNAAPAHLQKNDIGTIRLRTAKPIAFDAYRDVHGTGAFVLVDETDNGTVAGGMMQRSAEN
jgi:sulfate adenylyltransferase subunit 1